MGKKNLHCAICHEEVDMQEDAEKLTREEIENIICEECAEKTESNENGKVDTVYKETKFESPLTISRIVSVFNIVLIIVWTAVLVLMANAYIGIQNYTFDIATYYPDYVASNSELFKKITVISLIFFYLWLSIVYKNLWAFNLKTKTASGWVVANYFIPITNLYKPYLNMCELWDKSKLNNNSGSGHVLIKLWWFFVLLYFINVLLLFIIIPYGFPFFIIELFIFALETGIPLFIIDIIFFTVNVSPILNLFLGIIIINKITYMQLKKKETLNNSTQKVKMV